MAKAGPNHATPFKKGDPRPKNSGRARGTRNKITVRLRDCILEATELGGQDGHGKNGAVGYLVWLSRAEPVVFGRMLEKLLPMQVDTMDAPNKVLTVEQAAHRLRERGLPVPTSLLGLKEPHKL